MSVLSIFGISKQPIKIGSKGDIIGEVICEEFIRLSSLKDTKINLSGNIPEI